jgi:hypothetical protein
VSAAEAYRMVEMLERFWMQQDKAVGTKEY